MLTVFRSKAGADVLMVSGHARAVLEAMGRDPAPQGVFRGPQLAEALDNWAKWVPPPPAEAAAEETEDESPVTGLRQRAWPVCELLRRAQAEGVDVVWLPA